MIALDVEYLEYWQIANEAIRFLNQNNVKEIPIPIEKIIEYNYGINIIPIPGFLDLFGIDGFISNDFHIIYVDNFIYEHRNYRYRYTLAHEIGHFILHEKYLRDCQFNNIEEWINLYNEIDQRDRSKMEFQGYCFGGLVLVPKIELRSNVEKYLSQVVPLIEQAKGKGICRESYLDYAKESLADILSPIFDVSTDVLIRRINYDSVDDMIP